jgi:protein-disulfide isomerase
LLARISFVALGVLAALCVYLPGATYEVVAGILEAREAEQLRDPVAAWQKEPQIVIESKIGGAFGDYTLGNPSAPIQIVEFADFECPACRQMYTMLHSILSRYEGKYYFVFRNYPLDGACNPAIQGEFHRYACVAAMFTRCAGEQGKFWEALDLVFTDPLLAGEEPVSKVKDALVTRAAETLSLDRDGVVECLSSGRYLTKIQSDIAAGDAAGLEGTPALWINGKAVGRPSVDAIEKIFDSILQSSK